jgi:site-specific recombinase XerC
LRLRPPDRRAATIATRARTPDLLDVSVDYHRNMLSEDRTFLKWCVKKGLLVENPLDGVEGVDRRRHGKEQLRIDEARKWLVNDIPDPETAKGPAITRDLCPFRGAVGDRTPDL